MQTIFSNSRQKDYTLNAFLYDFCPRIAVLNYFFEIAFIDSDFTSSSIVIMDSPILIDLRTYSTQHPRILIPMTIQIDCDGIQ